MQRFDRNWEPTPRFLTSPEAHKRRVELAALFSNEERRAQTRVTRESGDLEHLSIHDSLKALFREKCAFCEALGPTSPYRFRPAADASPAARTETAHLYYAWLADAWDNIYSICDGCRPSDPSHFPVDGPRCALPSAKLIEAYVSREDARWRSYPPKERAQLLEPCGNDNFGAHFHPHLDGVLDGLTPRARTTIEHFNLNRPERVDQRAEAYATLLETLFWTTPTRRGEHGTPPGFDPGLRDITFRDMPFGGTSYLLLRRIEKDMAARKNARAALTPDRVGGSLARRLARADGRAELEGTLSTMRAQDAAGPPLPRVPLRSRPPSGARLTGVEIRDFKGIERLAFPVGRPNAPAAPGARAPAVLILGENASCKSSILEAIALALSGTAARKNLALQPDRLRLNPALMGDASAGQRASASVILQFDDGPDRRLDVDARGVSGQGREDAPPVFAYGAFRQYLDGRRQYAPEKTVASLFRTDTILSNPEEWLLGLKPVPFAQVIQTIRVILSAEGEFEVIRRDLQARRCVVVTSTRDAGDNLVLTETPLSLVSSGFRSVLAMVCDILQGLMDRRVNPKFETFIAARGVVLIDEIEAHLHPRWKVQIMQGLRTALPQMTFIATTHDPLCLRGMEDGEVLVLHRIAGAETARTELPVFVEQLAELPDVNHLTVQQLLTSDFFSMFSTDSPKVERDLAGMADLLARRATNDDLNNDEQAALRDYEREIARALPVGSSPVQRIVQEAVAVYLAKRRRVSAEKLAALSQSTRDEIVRALESI